MDIDRDDGRTPNQLRPLACSRNVLNRAHGSASWCQGDTKVLAAVYGPKPGTKKNENPEKACIEVIWKPKTGQIGKVEKEYEMILKRTLQTICVLTINPNTTTSVIVQVVHDDGALLTCAINAACAALVDAGIPMKHLAVAICCCLSESGYVILDPTKLEEQKMKGFTYLVFPNSVHSVLQKESVLVEGEPMDHGIITSVTHGVMSVEEYLSCLQRGRAACAKLSDFLRRSLKLHLPSDFSKAG
ncbi:exosome complex exonuclease RRP46 homolog [Ricinus communis]|uniref:exosome complex exonuclease RRP46 homolog n=1 Tax=Ricinus communis TaxID=3988 RepID=UPI000772B4E7|nr:exosome complex exonuclease RRP46 homolog [Ricinus communis]|eukprot:XP_015573093.1 exosome complex exonuclease RRP46 homolog [Ricinus communis]